MFSQSSNFRLQCNSISRFRLSGGCMCLVNYSQLGCREIRFGGGQGDSSRRVGEAHHRKIIYTSSWASVSNAPEKLSYLSKFWTRAQSKTWWCIFGIASLLAGLSKTSYQGCIHVCMLLTSRPAYLASHCCMKPGPLLAPAAAAPSGLAILQ